MNNWKDIRENGTVEGRAVETHYLHVESIGIGPDEDGDLHLALILDGPGIDYECRIPMAEITRLTPKEE